MLSKLNLDQQQDGRENDPAPSPNTPPSPLPTSPELKIPSPQIHFLDRWDHSKSVASVTTHSTTKQHSCHEPPPLPPPSPTSTPSPPPLLRHSVSTLSFQSSTSPHRARERDGLLPGIVHQAWSPVRTHARPKQTLLTTTRFMNRSPGNYIYCMTSTPLTPAYFHELGNG